MAEAGATWGDLQLAVIDEMGQRTDIAQSILNKLIESVEYYQPKIFLPDEAEQQYTSTVPQQVSIPLPSQFESMVSLFANVYGTLYKLEQKDQTFITDFNNQVPPITGPPLYYAIYQGVINLAPVPDNPYQITAIYEQIIPVPANDLVSNFWTVDAEPMVRHRAVGYLRSTITRSQDRGLDDFALARLEYFKLKDRVNKLEPAKKVKARYL
jgi:hypothetical protein